MDRLLRSAPISFSNNGDNTVISAPTSGSIKIYGILFTVSGAVNVTLKDSAAGAFTGAMIFTGNGSSMYLECGDNAYFRCQNGSDFVMNLSAGVNVAGYIQYTT